MDSIPDKTLFLQRIQENRRIIFKICNTYCQQAYDREDLAQDIICHLWKSAPQYDPSGKFTTWMYRVALNVAISFYRRGKRNRQLVPVTEQLIEMEADADNNTEIEDHLALLQQLINGFNELDKALMLLYLEERSYREIADILGISETNVATKINRLKSRLKQHFSSIQKAL
ncbi:RNA polymerase sigma factor [Chitinophaga solisilvae]|uniref:Sigma-70 family RNA polymerase sigma factor n=1 Tax=Chitinophaga solisilvae TaxID=1233460 RepID=A0A433WI38_9BACT|nr:sigma-70 family RNA polymerase sigma factor [Chitinophaga solisilvae]NSL87396.1 sigma-70 family RNA polymerase sigma factor [Chitinophaga solisilvae]